MFILISTNAELKQIQLPIAPQAHGAVRVVSPASEVFAAASISTLAWLAPLGTRQEFVSKLGNPTQ